MAADAPEILADVKELEQGFRDLVDGVLHQNRVLRQENAELRAVLGEYRRQIAVGGLKSAVAETSAPTVIVRPIRTKYTVPYVCQSCHEPYQNEQTHNTPRKFCDGCLAVRRSELGQHRVGFGLKSANV